MPEKLLTNSSLSCARACLRRYWMSYELGLKRVYENEALAVGKLYHEAQHHGLEAMRKLTATPLHAEIAARLYVVHQEIVPAYDVVAREIPFHVEIKNPDSAGTSRTFEHGGVIDAIVRLKDGRLAILEYKTTSSDITLGSDWWIRLRRDAQSSLYWLAARAMGHDVQASVYDVARRPAIRPRAVTQKECKDLERTKTYFEEFVGDNLPNCEGKETPVLFGARLTRLLLDDPHVYFQQAEIARTTAELTATARDVWRWATLIREAQSDGVWPRNPDSCVFPRRCDYFDCCDNPEIDKATSTPSGYVRTTDVHPEITKAVLESRP
jgi:hypothetical protein